MITLPCDEEICVLGINKQVEQNKVLAYENSNEREHFLTILQN